MPDIYNEEVHQRQGLVVRNRDFTRLGSYLGRPVYWRQLSATPLIAPDSLAGSMALVALASKVQAATLAVLATQLAESGVLGVLFTGVLAESAFDVLSRVASTRAGTPEIRIDYGDVLHSSVLEELFWAAYPPASRWSEWTSYTILELRGRGPYLRDEVARYLDA